MRFVFLLLIIFIALTGLFFYFSNNFDQIADLDYFIKTSVQKKQIEQAQQTTGTTTTPAKMAVPEGFNGPTGEPHIIGPQGGPPNY